MQTLGIGRSRAPHVKARRFLWPLALLGAAAVAFVGIHVRVTGQLPLVHRESVWSIAIYEGSSPFQLAPAPDVNCPALTSADVTDVRALFVADPFMVRDEDKGWFMFFEVLNEDTYQGDIGLATSQDGITWRYEQIVLDEPFHLSYPHVFRWNGEYFMVPESQEAGAVRLYRASEFPAEWQLERTLVTGQSLADPSVFRYQNMWWMFVGTAWTHDTLRLFFADELSGPWTEHPQSPIVRDNPDIARPGGRVTEFEGELYRFGQDCHPRYGNQLRAFHIASLSRNEYREEPIESGPVLRASGSGWNTTGMHHSDPVLLPSGRWRACVDGHRKVWLWRLQ